MATENLWAPWRLEYIRKKEEDGCFLCRALVAEEADRENLVLKRGRACAIVMNRYPYSNGHLLICPHRHVGDITLMTADERNESMDLLVVGVEALRKVVQPQGFNVGVNIGKAAGAGLEEHFHSHIVPRWEGDTNFMPVMADVRVIPQALLELWDELRPQMDSGT